jgi:predicted DNA-binding protein (MmcQ/YjbR family)
MNLEQLRNFCLSLPHVTEDVKWGHDLCFLIGEKMFLVVNPDVVPVPASFKTDPEEFEELASRDGCKPAPYLARYKWVHIDNIERMNEEEWKRIAQIAYDLVKAKLPKKILNNL